MTESATKFHITKKGVVEPCNAHERACPLKGIHFSSEAEAQEYLGWEADANRRKAAAKRELDALQLDETRSGKEIEIRDRWGEKKKVVIDRQWAVRDSSGKHIGGIEYRMVTRERRGKGNRYVSARWQVPGWVYFTGSEDVMQRRIHLEATSRKAALEAILRNSKKKPGEL